MVFPLKLGGRTNSLRYHQGTMKGLSGCIGMLEKFAPMGYVTPGKVRRFVPKNGSGYTLCLTRAATTVVGTVTAYQSLGWKAGVETVSPFASTLQEDCRFQPSRRESAESGWGRLASCAEIRLEKESTRMHNRLLLLIFINRSFAEGLVFKGAPLCRIRSVAP